MRTLVAITIFSFLQSSVHSAGLSKEKDGGFDGGTKSMKDCFFVWDASFGMFGVLGVEKWKTNNPQFLLSLPSPSKKS
jgi:hypothetical protein